MPRPEIELMLGDRSSFRVMRFKEKGDVEHGHKHGFDHYTALTQGSLLVEVNGVEKEHTAPDLIFIGRNDFHTLVAAADNTIATCIHTGGSEFPLITQVNPR